MCCLRSPISSKPFIAAVVKVSVTINPVYLSYGFIMRGLGLPGAGEEDVTGTHRMSIGVEGLYLGMVSRPK